MERNVKDCYNTINPYRSTRHVLSLLSELAPTHFMDHNWMNGKGFIPVADMDCRQKREKSTVFFCVLLSLRDAVNLDAVIPGMLDQLIFWLCLGCGKSDYKLLVRLRSFCDVNEFMSKKLLDVVTQSGEQIIDGSMPFLATPHTVLEML